MAEGETPPQDPVEELVHEAEGPDLTDVAGGGASDLGVAAAGEVAEEADPVEEAELVDEAEVVDEAEMVDEAEVVDELTMVRAERDEYLDRLARMQAEFENVRRRMVRDQSAHLERATEGLVEQLLPVLDAFELALLNAGGDPERLRKGVELVFGELLGVLGRAGLERIEAQGKEFDPAEHEAVIHEEAGEDGETGVTDVVRTGYRLKGRVLRPAMVKVAT